MKQSTPLVLVLTLCMLTLGLMLPHSAQAWPTKYTDCVSCHATVDANATISTAINGALGTTVTVAPGGSFQVDWRWTNATNAAGGFNAATEIMLPANTWTIAPGTANSPAIAGWNTVWDAADGHAWATANGFNVGTLAGATYGYTIDYGGSAWDGDGTGGGKTRNPAADGAGTGGTDLDGVNDSMGNDAIVTVPVAATPGSYTVYVLGIGHDGTTKSYVARAITVTVAAAGDTTAPVVGAVTPANSATATYVDGTFDLSATLIEANTLSTCEYTINGSTWLAGTVSGAAPNWTCTKTGITAADGSSLTLNIRGTDGSANTGTGAAVTRTVDALAPTTSDNVPAGWQAVNTTVTLTPADARSGVAGTVYCVDQANACVPGTAYAAPFVVSTEGTNYVRYRSTDNVGNLQTTVSKTLQIDKTGPTDGTLSVTPGNTQNGLTWSAATDGASGLRSANTYDVRFLTGATPPTCASGTSVYLGTALTTTHTGLTNGTQYSYRVCAYDNLSNVSAGAIGSGTPSSGAVAPTLTTPTATIIGSTTATLGATVTSDGGAALSARGTVWGAAAAPTGNVLAEGGTAVSAFTQARSALTAGSRIFYRGYATNAVGTSYSPDGSFYTEPATQASAVNFSAVGANGLTVNWTRGSGNAVIVLMHEGAAVDADPVDGTYTTYTANTVFPGGSQLGTGNYVIYKGTGSSVAVTGLLSSTTYQVKVYEVAGTIDSAGVNQGANYRTTTPASGSQATTAAANVAPTVTGSLAQYQSNGITVLASGGSATSNAVVVAAQVNDVDGDQVIIEVDIDSNGSVDCISPTVSATGTPKASCTALVDGSYNWQVRAKDSFGNTSGWTAFAGSPDFSVALGIDIGIDTTPPTESGLAVSPGDTVIDLSWNPADDGSGSGLDPLNTYKLVRSTVSTPADCSGAGVYSGNLNAYSDSGLVNGTTYYYRVCATDNVGNVSAGQTVSAAPGSSCTFSAPTVSILTASKEIGNDGGFAEYTISVTNNDVGACAATSFDLVVSDSNGSAFYPTTIANDPLNVAAGTTLQTSIRVTAKANQSNGLTDNSFFYTAADGNHAQSANSNTVITTINVLGGGCVGGGSYLNANGDQLSTSR